MQGRFASGVAAGIALAALMAPQPLSGILLLLLAAGFVVGALVRAWGLSRGMQFVSAALAAAVLAAQAVGWESLSLLLGAVLVGSLLMRAVCGYCITQDLSAAWRRVATR